MGRSPASAASRRVDDADGVDEYVEYVVPQRESLMHRAIALTRDRVDAEDLVQETLLKAYVSFPTFDRGTNVRAWLFRIMENAWIDAYRRAQRRPAEQLTAEMSDPGFDGGWQVRGAALPSAESEAVSALPTDADRALSELPEDLRRTVYYADVQGYRNTEVAAMLHIPVGTVGSRLVRGRSLLRAKLADKCA